MIKLTFPDRKRLRMYAYTGEGLALFARLFPEVEQQANAVLDLMNTSERRGLQRGLEALQRAISAHDSAQESAEYSQTA